MPRFLAKIRCRLRKRHAETCSIVILPGLDLQEHTHICVECGAVSLALLTKIDPDLSAFARLQPMGMSSDDQQRFLN